MQARRWCETVHVVSLGVLAGALLMMGAAAAVTFPSMRDLDPRLPGYAAYQGPHWSLAAGRAVAGAFRVSDTVQVVCGALTAGTLGVGLWRGWLPWRFGAVKARVLLVGLLAGVIVFMQAWFRPGMDAEMRAYWDAAAAGNNEGAALHKAAFDADHPIASRMLGAQLVLALAALGAGAWDLTGERRAARTGRGLEGAH